MHPHTHTHTDTPPTHLNSAQAKHNLKSHLISLDPYHLPLIHTHTSQPQPQHTLAAVRGDWHIYFRHRDDKGQTHTHTQHHHHPSSTYTPHTHKSIIMSSQYSIVHLKVKAETEFGQVVHVSGSSFTMGNFSTAEVGVCV